MKGIFSYIQGDRAIWGIAALLAVFSFLPVYSSSSNPAYLYGDGSTTGYLLRHAGHLFLGFVIMYGVHKIPPHYFKGLSLIGLPIIVVLLIFTLAQGSTIQGANASRWIQIPLVGITFQTSALAGVVLLAYIARYLSKIRDEKVSFKESLLPLWTPVFVVCALILPANFSTAAILFAMVVLLVFVGGYPWRYLGMVLGVGVVLLGIFILTAKAFPDLFPNRVDTWINRIENFAGDEGEEDVYQVQKAKIAIASGGLVGQGPGKSVQKNFLPQSSSDFIYAIIVEEWGLMGGVVLLLLYLLLLFRLVVVIHKTDTMFKRLLAIGVGLPIVFQALINMGVAVGLLPVTGQTLPLISSGGTSIWMTCLSLGIVLAISAKREETEPVQHREESQNPLEILSGTIKG